MRYNLSKLYRVAFLASVLGIFAFIFDFGFSKSILIQQIIDGLYFIVIALCLTSTFSRYIENTNLFKHKAAIFDVISVIYTLCIFYMYIFVGEAFKTDLILVNPIWVVIAVVLSFIREFSEQKVNLSRTYLNPAQIFILSFLMLIILGAFLLMLPKATLHEISFVDALFTSTSAVCVTGLIVVDTATYFTLFGQSIILFLIQIGGLGILTFASYFSYFFKGGSNYENQLTLSEMTNSQKVGEVFSTLKNIIVITAMVELTAAILIFFSLDKSVIHGFSDKAFFSVFHAISAFCNAGFSTLTNNIYETGFRFNYTFQLILIATFVLGGLGFPIVVNIISFIKHRIMNFFRFNSKIKIYKPWVLKINSRITLITTLILTIIGFVFFLALEYNNTLAQHSLYGKIVGAFFGATTPRTAGFNTVDMTALAFPTALVILFLMWVGASPASTGGGIKTSTLAIAVLNVLSLAKGKQRIEIFRREIADVSVKRASATIFLSIGVIGLGTFFIAIFDPDKGFLNIAFETISAFGTVGLSLGITTNLSTASKFIIIAIMFIGRVSMLSIILAIFKKVRYKNYKYPSEEITIN